VWRLLVRHSADYFVPYDYQDRVRTVVAEVTTGRTSSSSSIADVVLRYNDAGSSPNRCWLLAQSTRRRDWPVAASTVCRRPFATPRFSCRGADPADNSTVRKLSKRKVVSYIGARYYTCPWLDNVNFQKKFSNVSRFCALLMTSLIFGELGKPKVGPFVLFFKLNIMQKFLVREIKFRGNSGTV